MFGTGKLNGDYLRVSVADNHALPILSRHYAPVFLSRFLGCAVDVMAFESVLGRAGLILQQIEVAVLGEVVGGVGMPHAVVYPVEGKPAAKAGQGFLVVPLGYQGKPREGGFPPLEPVEKVV